LTNRSFLIDNQLCHIHRAWFRLFIECLGLCGGYGGERVRWFTRGEWCHGLDKLWKWNVGVLV
jgi:hypothetical protein